MNIIIVGCGRLGSGLAYRLYKKGHEVTVIDQSANNFISLPADFKGIKIENDALAQDVLLHAGIMQADGLAAVTNSDSVNTVVARIANLVYHVPNVVTRNYDPQWRSIQEALELSLVSAVDWSTQRIEDILLNTALRRLASVHTDRPALYELIVPAAWKGRLLYEALPPGEAQVIGLIRSGNVIPLTTETTLESNDTLYLNITENGLAMLRAALALPEEERQ